MKNNFLLKVLFCSVIVFTACSTCESTNVNVGRANTTVALQYQNGQNAGLTASDANGNVSSLAGRKSPDRFREIKTTQLISLKGDKILSPFLFWKEFQALKLVDLKC